MRTLRLASLLLLPGAALAAETATPTPALHAGDSWILERTVEKGPTGFASFRDELTVERVNDDGTMVVGIRRAGAPTGFQDHLVGTDWSQHRLIDGAPETTGQPYRFPLRSGKTWSVDYDDTSRRGNQLALHVRRNYRVEGWETVTVPAGTYPALKIVARGVEKGIIEVPNAVVGGAAADSEGGATFTRARRGGIRALTMTTYGEFYYAPAKKPA